MKNFHFPFSLIITCCLVALTAGSGWALDEGGCLTCHQYPGLVRLAKQTGLNVLHIDESKYFSSPHGKIRCIKCHITVEKVPHTGENKVDCTSECHQGNKEKKLPAGYPVGASDIRSGKSHLIKV